MSIPKRDSVLSDNVLLFIAILLLAMGIALTFKADQNWQEWVEGQKSDTRDHQP